MKRRFAEFETWQIFVSLMRLGSMSRVAKETGYETSFVSRRIAALEKSVGSKLFERTTRLCMPTHEAHALLDRILPYVVDLERRLEMASRAVKATRRRPQGSLRIRASSLRRASDQALPQQSSRVQA